jgi:ATP phosphoribosyltransferase
VDLVESGETMRAAKLRSIGPIFTTQAVMICNPRKHNSHELIEKIKRRIQGVIDAEKYVLCNYNIARSSLKKAIQVTPGKKAPTVSPLEDEEWVAVSSMVLSKQIADVMDELSAIGARDILVFNIHNCRVN